MATDQSETASEAKDSSRETLRADSDQAEAGLLRETFKESELGRRLHRSGIVDEVKDGFRGTLRQNATRFEYVDFDFSLQSEDNQRIRSPALAQQDRYVRCYVIAPYSDMQAERRLLAQEVFPTMRVRCMQIGIHFVEVDFGWGVPQNVAERKSGILNRLLEMRQNVRTYVIGLVGERYGYTYLHDADVNQGFLDPLFISKRPTVLGLQEVELDEGPLSPDCPHKCFFYFRDARYFEQVDSSEVRKALACEGLLSRERLSNMKSKLRLSSISIKNNYQDPEEAASLILADLSAQIAHDFPEDYTSENVSFMDEMITLEYEESILKTFFGREDEMDNIDRHVLGLQDFPLPTILCGDSGVGKSAIMVAWSRRFVQSNTVDLFFKHYAGLNNENGCWMAILKRALNSLKSSLRLRTEVPTDIDKLVGAFSSWINALPYLSTKVVFMLDGIDAVDSLSEENHMMSQDQSDVGQNLSWLPTSIPANFRMILSCSAGTTTLETLKSRKWNIIQIPVLDDKSRELLIKHWVQARGVRLSAGAVDRIMKRHQAKNPLFTVQVLRGIQCPDDVKPSGSMGMNLFSRSISELVDIILTGLETNRGMRDRGGLQEDFLSYIALSRRGLSEFELLDLMQIPRSMFSKFFLDVRQILKVCFGLLTFCHSVFAVAVKNRYLHHPAICKSVRMRLTEYFQSRQVTHRTVEELPWQLYHSRQWQELSNTIMNPEIFILLSSQEAGVFDLLVYWSAMLSGELNGTDLISKCDQCVGLAKCFSLSAQERLDLYFSLAELLQMLGFQDASLPFARRAYELEDRVTGLNPLIKIKYKVREVKLLMSKQEFDRAQSILEAIVNDLRRLVDTDGDGSISFAELRAIEGGTLLLEMEEELLFLLWKSKRFSKLGSVCKAMLVREYDRPTNKLLLLDSLIFAFVERGQMDTANDFLDDCLKGSKRSTLSDHLYILSRKLGLLLLQEQYQQIVKIVECNAELHRLILNSNEYKKEGLRLDIIAVYGLALGCVGQAEDGALVLSRLVSQIYPSNFSQAVEMDEEDEAEEEEDDAKSKVPLEADSWVNDIMLQDLLGVARRQVGQFKEAEECHKQALHLKILAYGANDHSISFTVSEIASVYECMRQQPAALNMRRVAAQICCNSQGYTSIAHFKTLLALASTHWKFRDFTKAEQLSLTVLYGVESRFGSRHEVISSAALLLGMAQIGLEKFQQAKESLNRAHQLSVSTWGSGHSDSLYSALALAQLHELNGDFDLCESAMQKLKAHRELSAGNWSVGAVKDVLSLAFLYFRIGALDEAEELLRHSLPGIQMAHGADSLEIACVLTLLVLILVRFGKNSRKAPGHASTLLLRAFRIRHMVFGVDSVFFLQHTMFTALLLEKLASFSFAEPLFRKSFSSLQGSSDASKHLKRNIYQHYEACNKSGFSQDQWRPMLPWSDQDLDTTLPYSDSLLDAILSESAFSIQHVPMEAFSDSLDTSSAFLQQQLHQQETPDYVSGAFANSQSASLPVESSLNLSQVSSAAEVSNRARPASAPLWRNERAVGVERPVSASGHDPRATRLQEELSVKVAGYSVRSAMRSRLRMDPDVRDEAGNTSLHNAVEAGDLEAVRSLVEGGASPNISNRALETPIHVAARLGNVEMLRILCGGGQDVNLAGPRGCCALHLAVEAASIGVVRFLCEQCGADITAEDDRGLTALELAVTSSSTSGGGQASIQIIEYLRRANDLLPSF